MKNDPLKMYFLFKMDIFHCYVSLPEGKSYMTFHEFHLWPFILELDDPSQFLGQVRMASARSDGQVHSVFMSHDELSKTTCEP